MGIFIFKAPHIFSISIPRPVGKITDFAEFLFRCLYQFQ